MSNDTVQINKNIAAGSADVQETAHESSAPVRNKYAKYERQNKKKMPKWLKISIAAVILAAIGFGLWFLINKLMNSSDSDQMISTGFAERGSLESTITGWGNAAPKTKAEVGGGSIGTVTEVCVQPGDMVSEGDVLFVVDPTKAKEDLLAAQAELDSANDSVNAASEELSGLTTRSPFSGMLIEASELRVGEPVSAGQELGRIVDDSKMNLSLYFSYGYIDEIKVGQSATVSVPASMTTLSGVVDKVEKIRKVNPDGTVCFNVVISMDNPGALTEDMTATAIVHAASDCLPYDTGTLEFNRSESIYAKSSGTVTSTSLHQFYDISAGQELLTLDNPSLVSALSAARRSAEAVREHVSELEKAISESVQTSPIDGQVMAVVIEPGDTVSGGGTPLVTIADTSTMIIETQIDEIDISKVSVGTPVTVEFDQSDGTQVIYGEVSTVSFEAESDGGMGGNVAYFPATILVENPGSLMPGMGVQYSICSVQREDCLYVPASALIYTDQGAAVLVRSETADMYDTLIDLPEDLVVEGFVAVPVEAGISDANNIEIISGIEEGTEVYLQQTSMPYEDEMMY